MEEIITEDEECKQVTGHEAKLAEAQALSETELLERLTIFDYQQVGFIPTEVVVTMFKSAHFAAQRTRASQFAGMLTNRMTRYAMSELKNYSGTSSSWFPDLEEAAVELVSRVWAVLLGKPKRAAHAERRFGQFFNRQAIDFRRWASADKRTKLKTFTDLLGEEDDDDKLPEEALTKRENDSLDPTEWVDLKRRGDAFSAALGMLNDNELQAVTLCFELGLPVESIKNKPSVSKQMGKTPRMIRNYIASAREKLRSAKP